MDILTPPGAGQVDTWVWLVATWFGTGLVEPLRTALALLTVIPILWLARDRVPRWVPLAAGGVLFGLGVVVADLIEAATGVKDARGIIIDEVAAFVLGVGLLRLARIRALALYAVLFLALDRLKPWPMPLLEALPGGWGVMADDLGPAAVLSLATWGLMRLMGRRRLT